MGLDFNPTVIVPVDLKSILYRYLKNLKDLPAKPQQKFYILRDVLLPRFHYSFSFYSYSARSYNDYISVRKFVKHILHLPHDVPNAFFYSSIANGGLSLLNARWRAPLLRYNKLQLFARNLGVSPTSCSATLLTLLIRTANFLNMILVVFSPTQRLSLSSFVTHFTSPTTVGT